MRKLHSVWFQLSSLELLRTVWDNFCLPLTWQRLGGHSNNTWHFLKSNLVFSSTCVIWWHCYLPPTLCDVTFCYFSQKKHYYNVTMDTQWLPPSTLMWHLVTLSRTPHLRVSRIIWIASLKGQIKLIRSGTVNNVKLFRSYSILPRKKMM